MSSNRFIKNTSWILAGQIVRLLVSFISAALTRRYLGPANMGIISYVSSYIAFFTAIVGLGLNGVIIYEFVNNREKEGKILGTAISLQFFASIISVVAFLLLMFCVDGDEALTMQVAFILALQLPFLCFDGINYWYQSNMNSKYAIGAQTVAYIITTAYKIYLIISKQNVIWFAFAITLDIALIAVFYFALYSKHRVQKLGFSKEIAVNLLRNGLPFILANLMVVVYGKMNSIMIKHILDSDTQVGLFDSAIALCTMIAFIPTAILDSSRPLITEAKNQGEKLYNTRFRQLCAGLIWICAAFSLFVTVFSRYIILIVNGEAYLDAANCLRITVWYTSFSYLGSAKNFWLICENKKRYVFIFSFIGALCNVALNLIFIPFWGINGAAVATLLTQILTNFAIPLLFRDTRAYGKCVIDAMLFRNMDLAGMVAMVKSKLIKRDCRQSK